MTSSPVRCFSHTSRTYYAKTWLATTNLIDEVIFGHYHFTPEGHDDGTAGEMVMEWKDLGWRCGPPARLGAYHDGWKAFASMPDLVKALGDWDDKSITPEQFTALLLSLGFRDITKTVDRYATKAELPVIPTSLHNP